MDSPGDEEGARPVVPGLPVHVLVVVIDRVEWHERLAGPLGPIPQVAVEHLFPRGGVHLRDLRENTVQVEQAAAGAIRKTEHAPSVRESIPAGQFCAILLHKFILAARSRGGTRSPSLVQAAGARTMPHAPSRGFARALTGCRTRPR